MPPEQTILFHAVRLIGSLKRWVGLSSSSMYDPSGEGGGYDVQGGVDGVLSDEFVIKRLWNFTKSRPLIVPAPDIPCQAIIYHGCRIGYKHAGQNQVWAYCFDSRVEDKQRPGRCADKDMPP